MSKITLKLLHGGRFMIFSFIRQATALSKSLISIVPTKAAVRRFRSGNIISRSIRHIFEHKHIHKILGSNLALAVLATSVLQIPNGSMESPVELEYHTVVKANTLAFATEKGIRIPIEKIKINQKYSVFHPGVDLDGERGDLVHAVMNGKVESTQYSRFAYGNAVIVDHGAGLTSLYAHLSLINVAPGDEVTEETVVGLMGSTGRSTGDHLHLEIRENGRAINPLVLLPR